MARMDGDAGAAYDEPTPFDIRGSLDRDLLIQALHRLPARHEAPRTRLVPVGGSALQVVDPPETGFPVTVGDLTGLPDTAERFARIRQEVEGTPFRLGEEPLVARHPETDRKLYVNRACTSRVPQLSAQESRRPTACR